MSVSVENIVNVTVEFSAALAVSSNFDLGCIIGESVSALANEYKIYNRNNYAELMVDDGFATSDPEFVAVTTYFAQSPRASRVVVAQYDHTDSSEGAINTAEKAFNFFRNQEIGFYSVCFVNGISDADIALVAAAVEAATKPTIFYYSSSSVNCITADGAGNTNILKTLKTAGYRRSFGFYSNDTKICPAILGLVSAYNSMADNSAYTLSYKTLAGVTVENLNDTQMENLLVFNGNVYTAFGNSYNLIYPAISAGNYHVDDMLLVDAAKVYIQNNVVVGLISQRKVPQTEDGVNTIVNYVAQACRRLLDIGLIAPGVWQGAQVAELETGDAVENGYYIYAGSVADQSASDKAARIAPPITVALLSAGAIEHVVITVFVNR